SRVLRSLGVRPRPMHGHLADDHRETSAAIDDGRILRSVQTLVEGMRPRSRTRSGRDGHSEERLPLLRTRPVLRLTPEAALKIGPPAVELDTVLGKQAAKR